MPKNKFKKNETGYVKAKIICGNTIWIKDGISVSKGFGKPSYCYLIGIKGAVESKCLWVKEQNICYEAEIKEPAEDYINIAQWYIDASDRESLVFNRFTDIDDNDWSPENNMCIIEALVGEEE